MAKSITRNVFIFLKHVLSAYFERLRYSRAEFREPKAHARHGTLNYDSQLNMDNELLGSITLYITH
jgi:hypothetical protein